MDNQVSCERADASVPMIEAKQDENMRSVDLLRVIQRTEMRDHVLARAGRVSAPSRGAALFHVTKLW
jgi:hypothetical protein